MAEFVIPYAAMSGVMNEVYEIDQDTWGKMQQSFDCLKHLAPNSRMYAKVRENINIRAQKQPYVVRNLHIDVDNGTVTMCGLRAKATETEFKEEQFKITLINEKMRIYHR